MENLELKHIVGYLPYGLKIYVERLTCPRNASEEILSPLILSMFFNSSYKIKPFLIPLSQLTEEINHNGEKFIPLLKVADLLGIKYSSYKVNGNSIDFVLETSYKRPNTKTKEPRKTRFWYNNYKASTFAFTGCIAMIYLNQINAIEKLYEWHFDIHGLIEKALAIDINTLPNDN